MFSPYISAYPLPSEAFYVLARTWQDLTVARAGCVRTLSLLIPVTGWASAASLRPFFDLLKDAGLPSSAISVDVVESAPLPLPPADDFSGKELLEAMFLEDAKPVALFDTADPELVAERLMTAMWPGLRARLALSTFALSPRKVEGRFFDLVFAPKDAKPRFSDWPGRRVDARAGRDSRHRWTGTIYSRVFIEPFPKLMSDREGSLIETSEDGSVASLRIALLWDELLEKVDRSPTAALGLLDIANSRSTLSADTALALTPLLREATSQALSDLPAADAWDFLVAIVRKMHAVYPASAVKYVSEAAGRLAKRDPDGALALLSRSDPEDMLAVVWPTVASGLAEDFHGAEPALISTVPGVLARLLASGGKLAEAAATSPSMISALARALSAVSPEQLASVRVAMLPLLTNDHQVEAAAPLIASLGKEELLAEVLHLEQTNGLSSLAYAGPISARARAIGATASLRHVLLQRDLTPGRSSFLQATLTPSLDDALWLISNTALSVEAANGYLLTLLRAASDLDRRNLLGNEAVLDRVPDEGADVLTWAVFSGVLSLKNYLAVVLRLLPLSGVEDRRRLASHALERCLPLRLPDDGVSIVSTLIGVMAERVDVGLVARAGLGRQADTDLLSRNLMAMGLSAEAARNRFVEHVDEIAAALSARYVLDLSKEAASSLANLLWAAQTTKPIVALTASGQLLPQLFRSRAAPVSIVVAACFPVVYRELASKDDVPDLVRFIPFLDWDRCKSARKELVDTFLVASAWAPEDLALTAFLCLDLDRILGRVAESHGGDQYLAHVLVGSQRLPDGPRVATEAAIEGIRKAKWK
ncbi:hypothetical protein ASC95_11160 [Pelomonas sp. Root1217]|nr:hypothetical protein ASC95_11160 [Pelomonas sp. Root1217]